MKETLDAVYSRNHLNTFSAISKAMVFSYMYLEYICNMMT